MVISVPCAELPSWGGHTCSRGHIPFACCRVMETPLLRPFPHERSLCGRTVRTPPPVNHPRVVRTPPPVNLPSLLVTPRELVVDVKYSLLHLPAPNFVQCKAKTIDSVLLFISENVPVNARAVQWSWGWPGTGRSLNRVVQVQTAYFGCCIFQVCSEVRPRAKFTFCLPAVMEFLSPITSL